MEIEGQTTELTDEQLTKMAIDPFADTEIRHFLVHRLEGDPAEVVRTQASANKPGLEQYRCLAQLCDPTAGGRNWLDSKHLYHPTQASSIQGLPAHIAEWKNLEMRVKSRSGEVVP